MSPQPTVRARVLKTLREALETADTILASPVLDDRTLDKIAAHVAEAKRLLKEVQ